MSRDKQLKAYRLSFPGDLEPERVKAFMHAAVTGTLRSKGPAILGVPTVVFETWSTDNGISWRMLVPWRYEEYVLPQMRTAIPGINIQPDDEYPRRRWTRAIEVGMTVPTRSLNIGNPVDAAHSILTSLTRQPGEALMMQWVVTPASRVHKPVQNEARTHHASLKSVVRGKMVANNDEVNDRRAKLDEPNVQAVLRIAAYANTKVRAKNLVFNVQRSLNSRASAGTGFKSRLKSTGEIQTLIDNASAPLRFPMLLSLTELTALVGFRLGNPIIPGVPGAVARQVPAPAVVASAGGRPFGMSNYPGMERPVCVPFNDLLTHCWWIGGTGAGKTTALANGIKADMENGHGIFLLESKGDLFRQALDYVPADREKDVIILDLSVAQRSVGLNLLDQGNPDRVIDVMTSYFEELYSSGRGVWSRAVFYNALKVLADNAGCGLLDLQPLLDPQDDEQAQWRQQVISRCRDEDVKQWFKSHDSKPEAKRQQIVQPVLDRVWEFGKPKLRAVLGQSYSSFQFADVVKNNKILLVNLAGVEPNAADMLGALIFDGYWAAVKDQTNRPLRPNFGYYDEFQRFVRMQADFADVLATSRSPMWGHTMANQYREQLPQHLIDALSRNTKTQVVFRAEGKEGAAFANEFGSLVSKEDFETLPPRTAIAKFAINGASTPAFTLTTLPPAKGTGRAQAIRGQSLATYGMDYADVEAQMKARRTPTARTQPGTGSGKYSYSDKW